MCIEILMKRSNISLFLTKSNLQLADLINNRNISFRTGANIIKEINHSVSVHSSTSHKLDTCFLSTNASFLDLGLTAYLQS